MTELFGLAGSYGPLAVISVLLAGAIFLQVKLRRNGGEWRGPERRTPSEEAREFRRDTLESLREIRTDVRETGRKVDTLVTKVATIDVEVEHLKRHCPLLERER